MTSTETGEAAVADAGARLDAVGEGLWEELSATPPAGHEKDASGAFALLKRTRATAMLIPAALGGSGATAAQAVRFQVALGSLAPSAAIATTMHHYKIAALGRVAASGDERAGAILSGISRGALLIASGGAESTPGRDLRSLGSQAVRDGGEYRVTGLKRPCSLSTSMDMMSLMVELRAPDGSPEGYAQAFVDARAQGLTRSPFWQSPVFLAAESHAVRLTDVRIDAGQVFPLVGDAGRRFASDCYLWFQLLISASYLGVASCLADATPPERRASSRGRREAVAHLRELEGVLLRAAGAVDEAAPARDQLNLAVRARDRVEDEIGAVGAALVRAAGGGAFARGDLWTGLAGAVNAIAFHPPQRGAREGVGLEELDADVRDRD
ncbi:acyl-CoA dehydrogenase family protein [Streptomyces sp. NPDC006516]|uniref:acyl-CoA dehydrogenase family protein n=1 Tax=Streptomyces sp. NPDC006516 TaxID=3154309 RepID=UPI0033AAEB60